MKYLKTLSIMLTCFMAAASVQAMDEGDDLKDGPIITGSRRQTVVSFDKQAELVGAVLLGGMRDYPARFEEWVNSSLFARLYDDLVSKKKAIESIETEEKALEALDKLSRESIDALGKLSETNKLLQVEVQSLITETGRFYLSGNTVDSLLEFLGRFIEENKPNSHIVALYVELLFRNAKAQESKNTSSIQEVRLKSRGLLEQALEVEEDSPLLLKTLFTYFLPEGDEFAIEKFARYCRDLIPSKIKQVQMFHHAKFMSEINGVMDIREEPLVKVALNVAPNIIEAFVRGTEEDIERQVKDILSRKPEKTTLEVAAETSGASAE